MFLRLKKTKGQEKIYFNDDRKAKEVRKYEKFDESRIKKFNLQKNMKILGDDKQLSKI